MCRWGLQLCLYQILMLHVDCISVSSNVNNDNLKISIEHRSFRQSRSPCFSQPFDVPKMSNYFTIVHVTFKTKIFSWIHLKIHDKHKLLNNVNAFSYSAMKFLYQHLKNKQQIKQVLLQTTEVALSNNQLNNKSWKSTQL